MSKIKNEDLYNIMKKYKDEGYKSLTEMEFLKLFLSYLEPNNYSDIAENIIKKHLSTSNLHHLDMNYLSKTFGMSMQTAIHINLIFKLIKICSDKPPIKNLSDIESAKKYFQKFFEYYNKENIVIVTVEENMKINGVELISNDEEAWVSYSNQKIISFALNQNAKLLFISHNHPKSTCEPSKNDIIATQNIINSLQELDITLVDHIVCGKDGAFSMRESIPNIKFSECKKYKSLES